MSGATVVFLGPSLPLARARALLEAEYRPPAEQGSVYDAVLSGARAIVLIDGAFGRVPAVRHKEILHALSLGVAVYGAASMGALRAAELGAFGMAGHGLIWRWYRRTPFADDDEVAVAMAPPELGSQALGEALINMRLTLRLAARRAVIDALQRRVLEQAAREIPFRERSWPRLFAEARPFGGEGWGAMLGRLEPWVGVNAADQKAADAASLLRALAAGTLPAGAPPRQPFVLTEAWLHDLLDSGADTAALLAEKSSQPP